MQHKFQSFFTEEFKTRDWCHVATNVGTEGPQNAAVSTETHPLSHCMSCVIPTWIYSKVFS